MKILVTGGMGFIGSYLVDALVKRGNRVRVFDNLEPQVHQGGQLPDYLNKKAGFIRGDVRHKSAFAKALKDIDVVYHLAAAVGIGQSMYQIKKYTDVNIGGTANLLEILTTTKNNVRKIVLSSSATVYGEGAYKCPQCGPLYPPIRGEEQIKKGIFELLCPHCEKELTPIPTTEEKLLTSRFVYSISKRTQEEMLLSVGRAYGIPVTVLRYFNVFGPRQSLTNPHTAVLAVFSARIKEGKPPLIIEDGQQTRDFIYIDDVVRATLAAGRLRKANFEIINIGSGRPITIAAVAQELVKLSGKPLEPEINFVFRKGDVRHCFAGVSKARKLLNWEPKVSFSEGVKKMYRWARDRESRNDFEGVLEKMIQKGLTADGR